jgi:hypothetical protein
MPELHPISCGCRACRGPVLTQRLGSDRRHIFRLTTIVVLAAGVVVAALLEALS